MSHNMPGGLSILVVDDSASSRFYFKEILEKRGHRTITADDGEQAIDLIYKNQYDLVLCDLVMPRIDGIEVLKTIRRQKVDTPFILVTQHASVQSAVVALKEGAVDYIARPIDEHLLELRIKQAINGHLLKKQLEKKANLETAMATIGAVTHELTQPLQAIIGQADLLPLVRDLEAVKQKAEIIAREAMRMGNIIHRLDHLTGFKTKNYIQNTRILDLEASSDTEK